MARKEVQPPRKIKVNLSLDAQLRRRLGAYAAFHGRDESDVVSEALESVLRGFVVHQRAGGGPPPVSSAESASGVVPVADFLRAG